MCVSVSVCVYMHVCVCVCAFMHAHTQQAWVRTCFHDCVWYIYIHIQHKRPIHIIQSDYLV